jgi:hypothetical protein
MTRTHLTGWMPRPLLLFPAALLLATLADPQAQAELRFVETHVDVGEVRSGAPLGHRFAFVNDGPAPAVVTEVRTSCGCLAPRLEPEGTRLPHTYQPGEQGALLLDVHTLGQAGGPHTWHLAVRYETAGAARETELRLEGRVVTEVSVQPAEMMVFADAAVVHELVVTDLRREPLHVRAAHTTSPRVAVRLLEESRTEAGAWVRKVRLEVAADYPEGRHEELLDLVTDDPTYAILRVPLTVVKRARQRLSATPNPVLLRAAAGEAVASRIVLVRDMGDQAVVVDRVTADDPALTCRWAQGPNQLATVKVQVERIRVTGAELHSAIHVHISKPTAEVLVVPVTCTLE